MSTALQSIMLQAMNTHIEIMLWCKKEDFSGLKRLAEIWFQAVERQFSRFRADSELAQIDLSAGKATPLSPLMFEVLQLAKSYSEQTEGTFNPLILKALKNAGYKDSFEKIKSRSLGTDPALSEPIPRSFPIPFKLNPQQSISLNPDEHTLKLPVGTEIDLGGIVKSWAVMRLVQEYQSLLKIERGFVNAGGDLSVWGSSTESGEPWLIAIENPWIPDQDFGILALENGSVATSSVLGKQWASSMGHMHHLIDPRTMQPSQSDVVQCTVTGPDVIECEIWAKVICILGLEKGLALLKEKSRDYEALVFTTQKETCFFGNKDSLGRVWQNVPIHQYIFNNPEVKI